MGQEIRFCRAKDGVRIGYTAVGKGPPLIKAANYLTHLEHDRKSPVWRHWLKGLSNNHTFIRYDARGSGLSDWEVDHYSIDAWVQDLEAVIDALNIDQFPLLGISQGAAVSIAYAKKYPDKVSHLILYGGYARGRFHRNDSNDNKAEAETLINTIRLGWGQENPAFRQLFTTLLIPEGTEEQKYWLNELARISATPENAATMERAFYDINVVHEAKNLSVPTLILHAREDACIPFEEGRLMATLIPGARFISLESKNHILLEKESAWDRFLAEIHSFLGTGSRDKDSKTSDPKKIFPELTPREREILELIARGFENKEIANKLFISPKTVRNHITHIFSKLQVESRSKAIVLARESGLGKS